MKTDREIQTDVMEELKWDPGIDSERVGISVNDGVVTLTGYVPSYVQKWEAEKAAERVAGVRAVADELEVSLTSSSQRNDVDIARAAASALKWNVSVPDNVKAIVDGGWVTLKGEVEWGFQKDAAESAVRPLEGVMGVINEIAVKPRVQPSEIKEKIEDALKRTAAEKAKEIDVEVDGGKVILKGKVHSFDEYWAARNAAWAAPGVTSVENDLRVVA